MTVHLQPHERPKPKAPLFYGDRIIGTIEPGTDDDVLHIKLSDLSPLVRELIKAELVAFHIINIPAE